MIISPSNDHRHNAVIDNKLPLRSTLYAVEHKEPDTASMPNTTKHNEKELA